MKAETAGKIVGASLLVAIVVSAVAMVIGMIWSVDLLVKCAFTAMAVAFGLVALIAIAAKALDDKK